MLGNMSESASIHHLQKSSLPTTFWSAPWSKLTFPQCNVMAHSPASSMKSCQHLGALSYKPCTPCGALVCSTSPSCWISLLTNYTSFHPFPQITKTTIPVKEVIFLDSLSILFLFTFSLVFSGLNTSWFVQLQFGFLLLLLVHWLGFFCCS